MITSTLESILHVALLTPMDDPNSEDCRWGAPTLLWGPPGIGKTGRIEKVGEMAGLPVETLYLSTLQPEDLSGIPLANSSGGITNACTLSQIQDLTTHGKGILFLDELTTARPAVQGAGLAVVYERRIAGKRLPGRVRVVGAANSSEDAAGGWNLALPMANRLLHVDAGVPSADDWVSWLLSEDNEGDTPIELGEETIRLRWASCWPAIKGLVAGFVKKNKSALYKIPAVGHVDRGRSWPSHRSWYVAARCMAAARALGKESIATDLLEASVGVGPTVEWTQWVQYADLPDPKDILDNGYRVNKDRLDVGFAVLSSAVGFAMAQSGSEAKSEYAAKAWSLLETFVKAGAPDLIRIPAKTLAKAGFTTKAGGDVEKAAKPVIAYLGVMMKDALN